MSNDKPNYFLPDFEPEEIEWPRAEYEKSTKDFFMEADEDAGYEAYLDARYDALLEEQAEYDRDEMPNLFGTDANTARYE